MSRSEDLLAEKIEDPVAAAVGAYALLRFSELERLHDWTRNLCDWFPWLPDGLAIRGEHLARMGQHEEAARHFTRLPERGLPLFCDGLSYAVERLKLYTRVAEDSPQPDVALAQEVRKRLWTFCKLADRRWPSLTFAGLDPARPVVEAAPVNWTDQQALAIGASQPPA